MRRRLSSALVTCFALLYPSLQSCTFILASSAPSPSVVDKIVETAIPEPLLHKASLLSQSIKRQNARNEFHPIPGHKHIKAICHRMRQTPRHLSTASPSAPISLSETFRVGLAGGIAGAVGTFCLFPIDAAKTLRQSDPTRYASVRQALTMLLSDPLRGWPRAYAGVWAATLGAIPSSALYFGAYESMKRVIRRASSIDDEDSTVGQRLAAHALAAASGNVLSSAVFVPKELIKQQMQYSGTSIGRTCVTIVGESGLKGLYRGYQATLMRNIPSAMLRFVLYEELKRSAQHGDNPKQTFSWKLFASGAVAGALASGFMTPVDVIKTRLSTGTCPVDVRSCLWHVVKEQGWSGLYAGAGSRMAVSGAFSAIGLGSFEAAKGWLGVGDYNENNNDGSKRSRFAVSPKELKLEHALDRCSTNDSNDRP